MKVDTHKITTNDKLRLHFVNFCYRNRFAKVSSLHEAVNFNGIIGSVESNFNSCKIRDT